MVWRLDDKRVLKLPPVARGLVFTFYALAERAGDGYLRKGPHDDPVTPESVIWDFGWADFISEKMLRDIQRAGFLAKDREGWHVPEIKAAAEKHARRSWAGKQAAQRRKDKSCDLGMKGDMRLSEGGAI